MKAWLSSLVLLGIYGWASAQGLEPSALTPSFDCGAADKTVEHWICASPELMQADERLTHAYRTAQAKPDGDAAIAALRAAQLRWLRQRNRCEDVACVAAAYQQRTEDLQAANRRVQVLDAKGIAPVFSRTLPHINDTVGVWNIALRRAQPAASCMSIRPMRAFGHLEAPACA